MCVRWTRDAGCLFIVNDRPDLARLAEADGVHLGQDDLNVAEARKILGPGPLIGISTHTPDQVRRAVFDGASYIGVGPTFASSTKEFDALAGLEFVRQVDELDDLACICHWRSKRRQHRASRYRGSNASGHQRGYLSGG